MSCAFGLTFSTVVVLMASVFLIQSEEDPFSTSRFVSAFIDVWITITSGGKHHSVHEYLEYLENKKDLTEDEEEILSLLKDLENWLI